MKTLVKHVCLLFCFAAVLYLLYFGWKHAATPSAGIAVGAVLFALLLIHWFVGPQQFGKIEYLVHEVFDREFSSWGEGALDPVQVELLHREWQGLLQRIYRAAIFYGVSQHESSQLAELVHQAINYVRRDHAHAPNAVAHNKAWEYYRDHMQQQAKAIIFRKTARNSAITRTFICGVLGAGVGMALGIERQLAPAPISAGIGLVAGIVIGVTNVIAQTATPDG
jgi:hypothetical protein